MLATEAIREKESNNKWQELIHLLEQGSRDIKGGDNDNLASKLCERIRLDIFHIKKIDEILGSDTINHFPDKKQELILERDELKIKASFNFFAYLVERKDMDLSRKIKNFSLGAECLITTFIYSGERLYFLAPKTLLLFIDNLNIAIEIWRKISKNIEDNSIWLTHEKSLRSIYASLYIVEDTYRYLMKDRNFQEHDNAWAKEDQRYENLLEDMDEWAKEEWTEEEQEAFETAMSNLS